MKNGKVDVQDLGLGELRSWPPDGGGRASYGIITPYRERYLVGIIHGVEYLAFIF